ncbi:MAG: hypothetical protein P8J27_04600 [Mariniblastus sp.]|nr:hypothetical protein [Mariniblastus sp.]
MNNRPFALIGVNSDDLDRAQAAVRKNEINWRSFQNKPKGSESSISDDWLLYTWPTIVVLDADFKVRYRGGDCDEATAIALRLVSELDGKPAEFDAQLKADLK